MKVDDNPCCANCLKPLNTIIICDEHEIPLLFCSYTCYNEYKLFDGGDDGYYSKDDWAPSIVKFTDKEN